MARIIAINSSVKGVSHELGAHWTTIGRADGNTFQVVEASISGRHCEVRLQGEELAVRDLLSTNGTFIAGQKISEGVVKLGQVLRLGDVELRFEASSATTETGTSFTSKMLVTNAAAMAAPKPVTAPAAPAPKPVEAAASSDEKKFNVLFVDDSLAFLELFGSLCSEYSKQTWEVFSATSADKALAILSEKAMDLVVLDIGMPMLDGLQLLGIISRRYPGMKRAVMTGNVTESKRADALANGAELFLEKPVTADGIKSVFNILNDLVVWTYREGFSGSLKQVSLQEVIQLECLGRHSVIFEIRNQEWRGQIYVEDGVVTHAVVGTLVGDQAFYQLMSLRGGEFQLKPFKAPPKRTINAGWETLLMEAARAVDEETVMLANPHPRVTSAPAAPAPEPVPNDEHALGDDIVVVAEYDGSDGKWTPTDPKPEAKPESKPEEEKQ